MAEYDKLKNLKEKQIELEIKRLNVIKERMEAQMRFIETASPNGILMAKQMGLLELN